MENKTTVKTSPILFQPWKVQRILSWDWASGNMQTRRLAGLEQFNKRPDLWRLEDGLMAFDGGCRFVKIPVSKYGGTGDRLWVRERFLITYPDTRETEQAWGEPIEYISRLPHEKPTALLENWWTIFYYADEIIGDGWTWRPSIFMPRWASRITLEIVSTRLERLQDISDADCLAEGVEGIHSNFDFESIDPWEFSSVSKYEYAGIWDKINGKKSGCSWASNPWVQVVEYKMCEG